MQHDYLVVACGERRFALATPVVEGAVAPCPVTPLPFVPVFVEGLVNVNERILPLLDLDRLLGGNGISGSSELVVIDTAHAACALRVSRVTGRAEISADAVQAHTDSAAHDHDAHHCVRGRFEWESTSVLLLDADAITASVRAGNAPTGQRGLLGRREDTQADTNSDSIDCILFGVLGERFAIDLRDAMEILDLPPATPIPGSPACCEGLARVRDEVILVLSPAVLLHRSDRSAATQGTVIVIARGDGDNRVRYGLRIDTLDGVRTYARDARRDIDGGDADSSISQHNGSGEIVAVLTGDDGLAGLLRPARLINDRQHAALMPLVPRRQQEVATQADTLHTMLHVSLGNEEFAIPLQQVRRIATWCAAEPLRDAERALVSGAVTVQGNVLPVVALERILQAGSDNAGAWVIVGDEQHEWAIAVREARDILEIPGRAIEDVGTRAEGFVRAVAHVDNRLLSLLTMAPLLTATTATGAHREGT